MHVPFSHAATCPPIVFYWFSEQVLFSFTCRPPPENFQMFNDESCSSTAARRLTPGGPTHLSRSGLGLYHPSFLSEEHFVLPPSLCAYLYGFHSSQSFVTLPHRGLSPSRLSLPLSIPRGFRTLAMSLLFGLARPAVPLGRQIQRFSMTHDICRYQPTPSRIVATKRSSILKARGGKI